MLHGLIPDDFAVYPYRNTHMLVWDVALLEVVLWDASLKTGAVTIGKVDQGAPGVSSWLTSVSNMIPAVETGLAKHADLTNLDLALTALRDAIAGSGVGAKTLADIVTKLGSVTATVTGTVAVTNLDVALSTRTKPADQQHAIIDSGSVTAAVTGTVGVSNMIPAVETGLAKDASLAALSNLDVALSTRTKPADQQHAIVDSGVITEATLDAALPVSAGVEQRMLELLTEIRMELRINNDLLVEGLTLTKVDLERDYRADPYFNAIQ